jgi:peroxiredoxin
MKMLSRPPRIWTLIVPLATAALFLTVCARADEIKLPWKSSGITQQVGYYMPVRLILSADKPEAVKKAPDGLEAPLYGEIKLGPADSPSSFFVILDEPEGNTPRLFIDANRDGDFTDDPPTSLKGHPYKSANEEHTTYEGGADLSVPYGPEALALHLALYRFDKHDPQRLSFTNSLFYYRDYGRAGEITLGAKNYKAILVEDSSTGDFRASKPRPARLFIDINGDQKYKMNSESFSVGKPFNIGGVTYELTGLSASGDSFQIIKSSQTVPESLPSSDLSAGHKALAFNARTTDGKNVSFPGAYKGKVVLLDFWATWCGPCRAELPNVTAAYDKFHSKGFDVLAVSLDRENEGQKLAQFTQDNHMPWPQIYDGKFWHAEVAQAYSIDSIPHAFLVDGDTGLILAEGDAVRGTGLTAALEKAFAHRDPQ